MTTPNDPEPPAGTVRVYHPSGIPVSLPVPTSRTAKVDYRAALDHVSAALAAGWLVAPPGQQAGEERETVGYVVRSCQEGKGGIVVPVVDLYDAKANHSFTFLRVYLDTEQDIAAFEAASGLSLNAMPEYTATGRVERGKAITAKYVVQPRKPFGVVIEANPKYDPDETDVSKKKPKWKFVRWVDQVPSPLPQGRGEGKPPDPAEEQRERDSLDDIARQRIAESRSMKDLMAVWDDTPPDVRDRVLADFSKRKLQFVPLDRPTLLARVQEAAKELGQQPAELLLKFSHALKLDPKRLPALTNLDDAQLAALARLASQQAQMAVLAR